MNNWQPYKPNGEYIPPSEWGEDHYSTLAYLESVTVDFGGLIDNNRMRCDPHLHKEFANILRGTIVDGSLYATRLFGGGIIAPHDDWSCVEDMLKAGLLNAWCRENESRKELFGGIGHRDMKVSLTTLGQKVSAALRVHRAGGGKYKDFSFDKYIAMTDQFYGAGSFPVNAEKTEVEKNISVNHWEIASRTKDGAMKIWSLYFSLGSWRFKINKQHDWTQFCIGFLRINYMPNRRPS